MAKRDAIHVRAPKDIMTRLRTDFPKMRDQDLIRMTYNTSLVKQSDIASIIKMEGVVRAQKKKQKG